jgi:L-fuculose-phosphate aldolase
MNHGLKILLKKIKRNEMAGPNLTPFEDTQELRRQVIETCFYMRDKLGYFVGTWGNISVRFEDGFLVTPSRLNYEEVTTKDLVVVSWEGKKLKGDRIPTSEMELHRQIFLERADIGALIHSHSTYASTVACVQKSIPVLIDDMAEVVGGVINCSPYIPAGKHHQLAQNAREAIGPDAFAVLLGNHGVVCGGRDLNEAVICSQFVEKAAKIYIQARAIGGVVPIPDELWREERDRYLYKYGKAIDLQDVLK